MKCCRTTMMMKTMKTIIINTTIIIIRIMTGSLLLPHTIIILPLLLLDVQAGLPVLRVSLLLLLLYPATKPFLFCVRFFSPLAPFDIITYIHSLSLSIFIFIYIYTHISVISYIDYGQNNPNPPFFFFFFRVYDLFLLLYIFQKSCCNISTPHPTTHKQPYCWLSLSFFFTFFVVLVHIHYSPTQGTLY
ncbi:hypothetical protein BDB00DRAFT_838082 [Zychaea mexicana]|uniref:uncharacterized protein n=1 Tax=Zychaea mexicana TaxID=64656 RepID=UPI0022FEFC24|nr:uncharacterized protein BDB00DRAFT_838082 [Zychaea mexicana]KAI9490338.1 hypothetical protein BDB00DRAFT_838082 [Zychaea mexicana]